ncbi:MAG TPA: delta-aminolevulinic acid dehydratase [Bacteroidota bacterium]
MLEDPGWELIGESLRRLEHYILDSHYRGYDPYDALTSPLFRLPVLRSHRLIRWGSQQLLKRLPLNVRPLLGIRRGYNPVTLGLCLQAFASLARALPGGRDRYLLRAEELLGELERLQSKGYNGPCWGYDFDWEARFARIPAFMPTVVATGFVTNALFLSRDLLDAGRVTELVSGAAAFVLRDLHRTVEDDSFCFSYSPADTMVVLNATMKGARLLAQAFALTGDPNLAETARCTVRFVMRHQRDDGAWVYQLSHESTAWVDHFHTGYVLDCLDEYTRLTGDAEARPGLERGLKYYLERFFEGEEIPKYYDVRRDPVDATAAAQSLLTLVRFRQVGRARAVASWMIRHMQDKQGYFYYQRMRDRTNRIPYMRWSNAWMFAGLASLWEHRHDLG